VLVAKRGQLGKYVVRRIKLDGQLIKLDVDVSANRDRVTDGRWLLGFSACPSPTARRQFQISCLSMDICRFGGMLGVMHNALGACYSSLHIEKLILQLIFFFSVFIKLLKYICGELVYTGLEARRSGS
jgi:hypothetical protein